jgi:hypothetical protein
MTTHMPTVTLEMLKRFCAMPYRITAKAEAGAKAPSA